MAPARVLLVRAGALGDLLLLRRGIAALSAAGSASTLLAPLASGRALLGDGPADAAHLLPWEGPDVAALLDPRARVPAALAERLAPHRAAVVYSRSRELADRLRALVAGPVLVCDPAPPETPPEHASLWLYRPLVRLGAAPEPALPPPLAPSAAELAAVEPLLRRLPHAFLAVHPGSGAARKNWPAARFAAAAERLRGGARWLLVGGPADAAPLAALRAAPGAVLSEGLPPRPLAALLARAGLFLGNDSGLSHLAGAAGAPVIALFGPTDPRVWAPVGARVRALRAPDGRIEALEVGAVVRAAEQLKSGARA